MRRKLSSEFRVFEKINCIYENFVVECGQNRRRKGDGSDDDGRARMKQRRKELGISVEAVAAALGVSVATVYRYEKGDIEKVPGALLEPLARVLHTTPAYLMGWTASPAAGTGAARL